MGLEERGRATGRATGVLLERELGCPPSGAEIAERRLLRELSGCGEPPGSGGTDVPAAERRELSRRFEPLRLPLGEGLGVDILNN